LKMQEAQIVRGFLFPADQQSPAAIDPRVGSFDLPAPRFAATMFRFWRLVLFSRDMERVTALFNFAFDGFTDIAFVEAKMLRLLGGGFGVLVYRVMAG
jgi:hypothetical protein